MAVTSTKKTFRMTRAYQEGFYEGRLGLYSRNPYTGGRQQEINDWNDGYRRGTVLKHFHEETKPDDIDMSHEILTLRRQSGERV